MVDSLPLCHMSSFVNWTDRQVGQLSDGFTATVNYIFGIIEKKNENMSKYNTSFNICNSYAKRGILLPTRWTDRDKSNQACMSSVSYYNLLCTVSLDIW